jgi:hypothetical protein
MRVGAILIFFAVALIPQFARAENPPSRQQFGALQAVFDFCSKVDPTDEKQFDRQAKLLAHAMTQRAADEARLSEEYKQSYQTLKSLLNGLPTKGATAACVAITTP